MANGQNPAPGGTSVPTPTSAPQKKVIAATGGAALGSSFAVIIMWAIESIAGEPPKHVSEAFNTIFTTLFAFLGGYYTPPGESETSVQKPDGTIASAVK